MTSRRHISCPHCKQPVPFDSEHSDKSVLWRLHHLLDHATTDAIGMRLSDLGDMDFVDYCDELDGDLCSWDDIASAAADLAATETPDAAFILGDECASAVYLWLREQYPGAIRLQCRI